MPLIESDKIETAGAAAATPPAAAAAPPTTAAPAPGSAEQYFLSTARLFDGSVGHAPASDPTNIVFVPSTLDAASRTVDVVWYGGMTVPRRDPDTYDPIMLRLDMQGCRLARLNAGAPVFDCHMNGLSYSSEKMGSKAQVGVVLQAWTDGAKGMATLKFRAEADADPDTDQLWSGIQSGIIRNLSFGTWIYSTHPVRDANGNGMTMPHPAGKQAAVMVADDWEPFEISPVTVPADFTTEFLSAIGSPQQHQTGSTTGNQPKGAIPVAETQQVDAGAEAARLNESTLAAREAAAVTLERQRQQEVNTLCATARKQGVAEEFLSTLTQKNPSADAARSELFAELARLAELDANGAQRTIRGEASVTRDGNATQFACMQAALLRRADPQVFANEPAGERRAHEEQAREFVGFTMLEMARTALQLAGINTRGMTKMEISARALNSARLPEFIFGGAESTSDFPSVLANVANKTLRQAYEAYPQSFRPFCRQVTAPDFKPINRMQLNDLAALEKLNERGEYHRATLSDSGINYTLGTFGNVVAITRKSIINDDMQAFTRTSMQLGVAAAQRQSNEVWGLVTANTQKMQDGQVIFYSTHNNLITGTPGSSIDPNVSSSNPLMALAKARVQMRLQKGPSGTPLDLIPRYIAVPPGLETYMLQLIYPINIASSDQTKVVPEWVRSLVPVVEPRLDNATGTATNWFLFADPAQIDTIEYCFLEGQEGVYFETRQGFDVDGVEMKARMDFAAAAIEHRGLQKNTGAA